MTWTAVLVLAAGTYALKAAGPLILAGRRLPPLLARVAELLPASLLAALIAVGALTSDGSLTVDARAAGVGAALVVAWRRGPFLAIVLAAAVVTATLRAVEGAM